MLNQEQKNKQC